MREAANVETKSVIRKEGKLMLSGGVVGECSRLAELGTGQILGS